MQNAMVSETALFVMLPTAGQAREDVARAGVAGGQGGEQDSAPDWAVVFAVLEAEASSAAVPGAVHGAMAAAAIPDVEAPAPGTGEAAAAEAPKEMAESTTETSEDDLAVPPVEPSAQGLSAPMIGPPTEPAPAGSEPTAGGADGADTRPVGPATPMVTAGVSRAASEGAEEAIPGHPVADDAGRHQIDPHVQAPGPASRAESLTAPDAATMALAPVEGRAPLPPPADASIDAIPVGGADAAPSQAASVEKSAVGLINGLVTVRHRADEAAPPPLPAPPPNAATGAGVPRLELVPMSALETSPKPLPETPGHPLSTGPGSVQSSPAFSASAGLVRAAAAPTPHGQPGARLEGDAAAPDSTAKNAGEPAADAADADRSRARRVGPGRVVSAALPSQPGGAVAPSRAAAPSGEVHVAPVATGLEAAPGVLPEVRMHAVASPASHSAPPTGPAMAHQVGVQIAQISRPLPDGPVELSLHPEELGRLKLSFTGGEAGLHVTVSADRPETLDMMRRHIDVLAQEMRRLGHDGAQFSFAGGNGGFDRERQTHTATELLHFAADPGAAPPVGPAPGTSPGRSLRLGEAGLDLRL